MTKRAIQGKQQTWQILRLETVTTIKNNENET